VDQKQDSGRVMGSASSLRPDIVANFDEPTWIRTITFTRNCLRQARAIETDAVDCVAWTLRDLLRTDVRDLLWADSVYGLT
jgi:hypothetical protein